MAQVWAPWAHVVIAAAILVANVLLWLATKRTVDVAEQSAKAADQSAKAAEQQAKSARRHLLVSCQPFLDVTRASQSNENVPPPRLKVRNRGGGPATLLRFIIERGGVDYVHEFGHSFLSPGGGCFIREQPFNEWYKKYAKKNDLALVPFEHQPPDHAKQPVKCKIVHETIFRNEQAVVFTYKAMGAEVVMGQLEPPLELAE